jgi:hypothetical protein
LKKTIEQIENQKADVNDLDDEVRRIREQNAKLLLEIQEREAAAAQNSNDGGTIPATSSNNLSNS